MDSRASKVSEDEKQALKDYIYQTMMRDGTTEYAISILFDPAL
jgi:hypothetical protein